MSELIGHKNTIVLSVFICGFMPLVGERIGNGRGLRYILFTAGILTIPFGLLSGIPLLVFVVV